MTDAFPMIRYCSWLASTQKTVSMVALDNIWVALGVRMSVVVTRMGREGVACAEMNSR